MVYETRNYWVFGLCPSSGISAAVTHTHTHLIRRDECALYLNDILKNFLGCNVVKSDRCPQTFQRNILHPSSGLNSRSGKEKQQ
jgi:hypothetical protein